MIIGYWRFRYKITNRFVFWHEMDKENIEFYMATRPRFRGYFHFISHFVPLGACSGYTSNADSLHRAKNGWQKNAFES